MKLRKDWRVLWKKENICLHYGFLYPFYKNNKWEVYLILLCVCFYHIAGCVHLNPRCFVSRRLVIAVCYRLLPRSLKSTAQDINTIGVCPVSDLHNHWRSCLIRFSSPHRAQESQPSRSGWITCRPLILVQHFGLLWHKVCHFVIAQIPEIKVSY